MKYDCSCHRHYPNIAHKKKNGRWSCMDDYLCIRDYREGKNWDCCTHCVRKENFERYRAMPNFQRLVKSLEEGSVVKTGCGDYVVYRRDWLYEHIEQEYALIKSAKALNVKKFDINDFKKFMEKGDK